MQEARPGEFVTEGAPLGFGSAFPSLRTPAKQDGQGDGLSHEEYQAPVSAHISGVQAREVLWPPTSASKEGSSTHTAPSFIHQPKTLSRQVERAERRVQQTSAEWLSACTLPNTKLKLELEPKVAGLGKCAMQRRRKARKLAVLGPQILSQKIENKANGWTLLRFGAKRF